MATKQPEVHVQSLCRACLMAQLRVAANGISTGVWHTATISKVPLVGIACSVCQTKRAKHQLTLST